MPKTPGQITVNLDPENYDFMVKQCEYYRWGKSDFINQVIEYARVIQNLSISLKNVPEHEEEKANTLWELLRDLSQDFISIRTQIKPVDEGNAKPRKGAKK